MPAKILDFKTALITGGAGGLGYGMAEWLLKRGKKVIIVGRTKSNLEEASAKLGNCAYYVLDTGNTAEIPAFAKKVIADHPDVDCLINNAGVQRTLDVTNLELDKVDQELDINVRGPIHLADAFLKHFAAKPHAVIINVTSVLGFCPFSITNPAYNASKAYMHFYTMSQREQLKATSVRVVEVIPPQVHTALHRDRDDPDDNNPSKSPGSLTVDEFMRQVGEGWEQDQDTISAGPGKAMVKQWYDVFGEKFQASADKWQAKPM